MTQIVYLSSSGASVYYSPDARRVAYVADREGEKYLVVDGTAASNGYNRIEGVAFSPDSRRLAYIGVTWDENPRIDRKWTVVVDGVEGDAYSPGCTKGVL